MTNKSKKKGQIIINEAIKLLRDLRFTTPRGGMTKGEWVEIIADPRWDEETETFRLLVTCYPPAQWDVDWGGMPIMVSPSGQGISPSFIGRLSHRGQTIIRNLPSGSYRVSASSEWFFSDDTIIRPMESHAAAKVPERLAASGEETDSEWPELPPVFTSSDERILLTLEQDERGVIALSFETKDEALENETIRFAIVHPDGHVNRSGKVKFTQTGEEPLWGGKWKGELNIDEPCHIMFECMEGNTNN